MHTTNLPYIPGNYNPPTSDGQTITSTDFTYTNNINVCSAVPGSTSFMASDL